MKLVIFKNVFLNNFIQIQFKINFDHFSVKLILKREIHSPFDCLKDPTNIKLKLTDELYLCF